MKPFTTFTGIAAPLVRLNVNTDAIIPGSYLRSPSADLAHGFFAAWRYDDEGCERPDFVLNQPPFRRAEILLSGPNFGCGSSREQAVWAVVRFGIKAVFAPKFADIFYENSFRNGLLPGIVAGDALAEMAALALGGSPAFTVDLENRRLTAASGRSWAFEIPDTRQLALLRGDDAITETLRHADDIEAFHAADLARWPWAFPRLDAGAA
jgi:3-isopropylmalate/(R)-2-methylmalate dehydratase small subunit